MMRLLLLAGTQEARQIATMVMREPGVVATASLAWPERRPHALGIPTRIGGFDDQEELRDYLLLEQVTAILDATHPFANGISHRAAEVAAELGLDHARFLRRPWLPTPDDRWTFLNTEAEAANHIGPDETVFLATGRHSLDAFANLAPRRVYCRVLDTPDEPYPHEGGRFLVGRPPFTLSEEEALFHQLGVDWLVIRNSGGTGSWPKVEAARNLGLRVAVIRRPLQPPGTRLETLAETTAWIRRRR